MATLKDIAIEAGVSVMTVSNVINGKNSKVSEKNRTKINELVKKYNYVPNLTARSLTVKSSKIIGIILPSNDTKVNLFKNPYISELFGVIETALREEGYYVMIKVVNNISKISELLKNWNMDGAIFFMPDYEHIIYSILKQNNLPMVFIDSYSDLENVLGVSINDYKGGYIATKYLLNYGHKKILFAGPCEEDNTIIKKRLEGYKSALSQFNIPFDKELVVNITPTYEAGIDLGRNISNGMYDVTSVVTTADIFAIGVMEGARINGMIIPNDLSIIGFDNLLPSIYVTPKLTTISQNIESKGKAAVKLLIDYIKNGSVPKNKLTLDVELIERQSVKRL